MYGSALFQRNGQRGIKGITHLDIPVLSANHKPAFKTQPFHTVPGRTHITDAHFIADKLKISVRFGRTEHQHITASFNVIKQFKQGSSQFFILIDRKNNIFITETGGSFILFPVLLFKWDFHLGKDGRHFRFGIYGILLCAVPQQQTFRILLYRWSGKAFTVEYGQAAFGLFIFHIAPFKQQDHNHQSE